MRDLTNLACPVTGNHDAVDLIQQNGFRWVQFRQSGYAQCLFSEEQDADNVNSNSVMAHGYLDEFQNKRDKKLKRTARRVSYIKRLMKGPRIIDVGSNVGYFVESARQAGLDARGIEINPGLYEEARRQFPDCHFTNSGLEDFCEGDGQFDAVYCSEVIEHVPDVIEFAERLKTLLKPGGVLFLTTPALDEYMKDGRVNRYLGAPDHRLYFNRKNILAFLQRVGFSGARHRFSLFGGGLKVIATR